jgi:hypothetical protein
VGADNGEGALHAGVQGVSEPFAHPVV